MYRLFICFYHLFFGIIALYTLVFSLFHSQSATNFFSYFTNLSNIFACGVFLYVGFANKKSYLLDSLRGAAVVYTVATGIVYAVLLQATQGPYAYPWVLLILHKVMPVAVSLSWILYPTKHKIAFIDSFFWTLPAFAYLAYTFIHGFIVGWYPYFFLNPLKSTFIEIVLYCLAITISGWAFSLLVIFVGNRFVSKKYHLL